MTVRFLPEAEFELAEAVEWYEARGRGLGAEFLRMLDAALAAIGRNPHAYAIAQGRARRALLRRYPYNLIYTVNGADILIVACFHTSRNPKQWQERLR